MGLSFSIGGEPYGMKVSRSYSALAGSGRDDHGVSTEWVTFGTERPDFLVVPTIAMVDEWLMN
jgi:hypothetical protein